MFDKMRWSLLTVSDMWPWKTAKLSGKDVWAANGGLSASRHGVPSLYGNARQWRLAAAPRQGLSLTHCGDSLLWRRTKCLKKRAVFWGEQGCPACCLVPSPGHLILCEVSFLAVMSQLLLSPLWQRWERWLSPLVGRAGSEPRESVVSIWKHPAVMERLRALRGEVPPPLWTP